MRGEWRGGSYACIQKASVTAARAARDERESADKEDNRGESKVRAPVRLRRGRGRKKKKKKKKKEEKTKEKKKKEALLFLLLHSIRN